MKLRLVLFLSVGMSVFYSGYGGAIRKVVEIPSVGVWLEKPLVIDASRSSCIVRAKDSSRPALVSGGRRITGWKVGEDGVWRVNLPEVKEGKWNFSSLYVNGTRRFRPRLPESGFYLTHTNAFVDSKSIGGFAYRRDDVCATWEALEDVELLFLHSWSATRARIGKVEAARRIVSFATPRARNYMAADDFTSRRYRIENVKEAFTKPGQWYLERKSGCLSYRPLPGEKPDAVEVVAPKLRSLVEIKGAKDVIFENIVFAHQDCTFANEGFFAYQSAFSLPAAVTLVNSSDIVFRKCAFVRIDGNALSFGEGTRRCRAQSSVFRDLGGGAVRIGLFSGSPQGASMSLSNVVENCIISAGGRRHPDAVAVLVGKSSFNRIEHNEIFDFYYSGVSCGWDWNNGPSNAHHNKIAFNHIYNIGQHILSDMGLVYFLGRAPGTIVHDNYLHDIRTASHGGTGIYLDNGSAGIDVWNNFVCDTMRSLHQNYGENCRVWNNIFINGHESQWDFRPRYQYEGLNLDLKRNIFLWHEGRFMYRGKPFDMSESKYRQWNPPYWQGVLSDSNVYWCVGGKAPKFGEMTVEEWREKSGNDVHSCFADPCFDKDGISLRSESPAFKLGFKPFDCRSAGLRNKKSLPVLEQWETCSPYCDVTGAVWKTTMYDANFANAYAKCLLDHEGWSTLLMASDSTILADGRVPFVRPFVENGNSALCSTSIEQLYGNCWRWHYGNHGSVDVEVKPFKYGWVFKVVDTNILQLRKLAISWLRGVKVSGKGVDKEKGIVNCGKYAIVMKGTEGKSSLHLGDNSLVYLEARKDGTFHGLCAALAVLPKEKTSLAVREMDRLLLDRR